MSTEPREQPDVSPCSGIHNYSQKENIDINILMRNSGQKVKIKFDFISHQNNFALFLVNSRTLNSIRISMIRCCRCGGWRCRRSCWGRGRAAVWGRRRWTWTRGRAGSACKYDSTVLAHMIQRCPSLLLLYFVKCFLEKSPGWGADTVTAYCPLPYSQLWKKT